MQKLITNSTEIAAISLNNVKEVPKCQGNISVLDIPPRTTCKGGGGAPPPRLPRQDVELDLTLMGVSAINHCANGF